MEEAHQQNPGKVIPITAAFEAEKAGSPQPIANQKTQDV
jgi:hypothetical protein